MRSGGGRQIDEIDSLGGLTKFFLDDRPAAPRQRIGHYQRPCTHSPASIPDPSAVLGFSPQIARDTCVPHVSWQNSFSLVREPPLTLYRGCSALPPLRAGPRLPLADKMSE